MAETRLLIMTGICISSLVPGLSAASDLSFTFIDFQFSDNDVDANGMQSPAPSQTVSVASQEGDGISVAGSLAVAERFFLSGRFESSIIDIAGTISSPLATVQVTGDYDLVESSLRFGYHHDLGESADVIAYAALDSVNYDFGSFAGENFDLDESGAAFGIGVRWNPMPALELHSTVHYSSVGEPDLNGLELENGALIRTGFMWYFFEDLGLGVDYESGAVDAVTASMRFSFRDLAW